MSLPLREDNEIRMTSTMRIVGVSGSIPADLFVNGMRAGIPRIVGAGDVITLVQRVRGTAVLPWWTVRLDFE